MSQPSKRDAEALRHRVSIGALLEANAHPIHGRGRTRCPLCDATNPSTFSFNETQWQCFRCGRGGDVFALAMALEGCGFRQAVAAVANIAGIDIGRLPRLTEEVVLRRAEIAGWRRALHQWAQDSLNRVVVDLHEDDLNAEAAGRLVSRYRAAGDEQAEGWAWDLLQRVCEERDEREWLQVQLERGDEDDWARIALECGEGGDVVERWQSTARI